MAMSEKASDERLDKIVKRLDIVTVILLVKTGLTRKEIAEVLGVSEKTIERLIPISKIKGTKSKKLEAEPLKSTEVGENEQGQQQ